MEDKPRFPRYGSLDILQIYVLYRKHFFTAVNHRSFVRNQSIWSNVEPHVVVVVERFPIRGWPGSTSGGSSVVKRVHAPLPSRKWLWKIEFSFPGAGAACIGRNNP